MWGGLSAKPVCKVRDMDVNCWMRRSGIESPMGGDWEAGTESGICEGLVDADVEESNGGTGGNGLGGFLPCVGEPEDSLSTLD